MRKKTTAIRQTSIGRQYLNVKQDVGLEAFAAGVSHSARLLRKTLTELD
jgi:hypothetical protein